MSAYNDILDLLQTGTMPTGFWSHVERIAQDTDVTIVDVIFYSSIYKNKADFSCSTISCESYVDS